MGGWAATTVLCIAGAGLVALVNAGQDVPATGGMPIARIKESLVCCPQESITVDGWASVDPGGEVVQWQWDVGGDGRADRLTDKGDIQLLSPREARTYRVILRVLDNAGNLSAPETASVCVMNAPPRVSMPADTVIKLGARMLFRPDVRTTCGTIERYEWDFDDDNTYEHTSRESGNTSRPYYRPGRYLAKLRVVDSNGRQAGGVTIINVTPQGPGKTGK